MPATYLAGQEFAENNFDHYTTANGISHNTITGIVQDSTGYVWLSTYGGLSRYNGSRFIQFHSNDDSLSLPSELLSGISWLDRYRLAVYASGLHIVDTRTGKTRNIFIPCEDKQYQYKFNMIEKAAGDENGNIFILSRSGFYHYDSSYKLVSRFDYYKREEVPYEHFFFGRDFFNLDDHRILIISIGGLYIYDKVKRQVKKMEAAAEPLLAEFDNYPSAYCLFFQPKPGSFFIVKDQSDSLIYINTITRQKVVSRLPFKATRNDFHYRTRFIPVNDTLFYITGHNAGFFKMRFYPASGTLNFYPTKYFASHQCNMLMIDRDNDLWVATKEGLYRQDHSRSQVELALIPASISDSFPDIKFDDVYVSSDKLYAGARGKAGLMLFDKKTLRFQKQLFFNKYLKQSISGGNTIDGLLAMDSSTLLMCSDFLLLFDRKSEKVKQLPVPAMVKGDWVNDLCRDSKGNIWISAYDIHRYNTSTHSFTSIPFNPRILSSAFVIEEDRDGNIWMANHGLTRYNTMLNKFDRVVDSFPFIKMMDKQVASMVIDQRNNIWFSSSNNGLTCYSISSGKFRHFTRSDGLPDNNIASMIVVGDKLWMACISGSIACIDLRTFAIVSFGEEDGFPKMSVYGGARFFYDSSQQQLYIGFTHAVARFNPYEILKRKPAPRVFVENLVINGEQDYFLPGRKITTSWRNNELMITIGSINFSDGHSQGFAYRIVKDENSPWQQLGSQPSFSISNLSPGDYRIQVKSFSLNNRWPAQVKEVNVVVSPPFWKEKWFVISVGVFTLVLLYLLIQWRTDLARRTEMEKTNIEKLKADDYKNQFELEQISNYFSSSLANKKTEDEVLWDVAGNLIGRMNYVDCMIYLWNEDKTKMIQKAAFGPKGKPEFISAQVFDVKPGQGIVGHVVETCQPVLVKDTRTDSRYRVDEQFRLSEVCVPIIHDNELMGVIDSEHHLPDYFSDRDIKILTTIATLIGNKLKQLESEQSLEEKKEELVNINEQLAEAKLAALQAQMNPHFVFNALNSIKRMILDGNNEKASRYLSKFALMIRMTLNHSKDIFVTLDENIEYLKTYLEMEQLRFDDSFTYNIFTEENIDAAETPIPSLMIQPLVENAIWHGLMPSEDAKKVMIGFTQYQNQITCTIEDNGIGIHQSEKLRKTTRPLHHSVGLENLQKRIKIINEKYETNCSLEITDLKDIGINKTGTRAVLRFNIINT
jgi:putative methionine-R-sulfoxide reductase with GAF domain